MSLSIQNIAFERDHRLLFQDIDCHLSAGELLQISGTNGSGKSTLLRIIAGLLEPLTGKIIWNTEQKIHYLGHENSIKTQLTVRENIQLFCALQHEKCSDKKIETIQHQLKLSHISDLKVTQLSAGQTRRVALSRLLLSYATLWILDEPTTSLDIEGQAIFFELLQKHLKNNGMAILTTHYDMNCSPTHHIKLNHVNYKKEHCYV